jgi:site-specific DNA-methyltransferase (adenine-specific)
VKKARLGNAVLYHAPMEEVIPSIQFDHIFTDPPYLYIKTHGFDKEFDEALLFENARRILPDNGFIALFGRGSSFYRWNARLAELGFAFKEEIVWNKRYITSPCMALSRVHETISIHTKKTGKIRRVKVPYIEQKQHDVESIINDIKIIKSAINNEAGLNKIVGFLKGGGLYDKFRTSGHCVSQQPGIKDADIYLKSMNKIANGMNEKTIIDALPVHFAMRHPTEKPVRLAERVIALISDPGDTIYDPFMGSGSFGVGFLIVVGGLVAAVEGNKIVTGEGAPEPPKQ